MNNALLLTDWTVTSIDQQPKLIRFHASYDIDPDHCLHCGTVGKPLGHGPLMLPFADTPFAGRPASQEWCSTPIAHARRASYPGRDTERAQAW